MNIQQQLERLERRNRTAQASTSPAPRYLYLRTAYRTARKLAKRDDWESVADALKINRRGRQYPLELFIDGLLRLTSTDDRRLRSKHAQALKYVSLYRAHSSRVKELIQEAGGFNGAAELFRFVNKLP